MEYIGRNKLLGHSQKSIPKNYLHSTTGFRPEFCLVPYKFQQIDPCTSYLVCWSPVDLAFPDSK